MDEIFVTGFSVGGGLSHIIAYLMRVMFLPFFGRLVTPEYHNRYGLSPLTCDSSMPHIRIATMAAPRVGNAAFAHFFTRVDFCDRSICGLNFVTVQDDDQGRFMVDPLTTFPSNKNVSTNDEYFRNVPYVVFLGLSCLCDASYVHVIIVTL